MSDFAIISDLSINVDEIQKDGSFYDIAGTFVVEGNAESLVKVWHISFVHIHFIDI